MQQQNTIEHEQELLAFVDLNAPERDQDLAERQFDGEYIRTDFDGGSYLLVTMYSEGQFDHLRIDLAAARGAN